MAHARVSPTWQTDTMIELQSHYGSRILACVEELRVNTLISRIGFDLDLLHDGSEKPGGTRIATTGGREMWNEAVSFTTACVGSPTALHDFLSGVRKGSPEWARALTKMSRQLLRVADGITTTDMASTVPTADGTPTGYVTVIEAIGRVVRPYLESALGEGAPYSAELARQITRATEPGARRAPSGRWAPLVVRDLALSDSVNSPLLGRRRRAASSGTKVMYPGNALRDPQRRIFAGAAPAPGGVVVIDQSGSMDLGTEQLDAVLSLSPSLTVIGYSHRPGDTGTTPNAWILARAGRRVAPGDLPPSNIGNGVDLPVLEFAQRLRRPGEPLVWVCDGQTTDSNDHPYGAKDVAHFIRGHRVHCVRNVDALLASLRGGRPVLRQMRMAEGRVGRSDLEVTSAYGLTSPDTSTANTTSPNTAPPDATTVQGVTAESIATSIALTASVPTTATSSDEVTTTPTFSDVVTVEPPSEVPPDSYFRREDLATVGYPEPHDSPLPTYVAPVDFGDWSEVSYGLEL